VNKRERLLAGIVGGLALLIAAYFLQSYVSGAFRERRSKVDALSSDIKNLDRQILLGRRASSRLVDYEARSLPPEPEVARSLYQAWLLTELGKAGFVDPQVKAESTHIEKDLFVKQTFSVTGLGTLPQLVDLMHAIYSKDYLQRVTMVIIKPIENSKQLDVKLTIEAVSMEDAEPSTQLHDRPSPRVGSKEVYAKAILDRNLFGPPNQSPKLALSRQRATTNRPLEFGAKASDADPLDRMKYALVKSADPGAKLDPTSGRFTWTPKKKGEYEFVVEAVDDGLPSKRTESTVVISVSDPLPAAAPAPTRLAFDDAKYTVLTAVLDVSGEGEVWLHVRPKGQTLKLRTGDKFEVGSVKGRVAEIGQADFVFEADGKQHRVGKGEALQAEAPSGQARQFD
jgi:hypothetical protein